VRELLRLTRPAHIDNLGGIVECVSQAARAEGFSEHEALRIELVCEEAVTNVMNYAYGDRKPGDMEIACFINDGGQFVMEISDYGPEFNSLDVPPPDMKSDLMNRRIGGLGLHLIRELTGDKNYKRVGDRNVLTLAVLRITS
jgi:serine/threonine-protein kinase RsbW